MNTTEIQNVIQKNHITQIKTHETPSGTPETLELRGRQEDAIAQSRKVASNLKQSNDLLARFSLFKLKNGEMNECD